MNPRQRSDRRLEIRTELVELLSPQQTGTGIWVKYRPRNSRGRFQSFILFTTDISHLEKIVDQFNEDRGPQRWRRSPQ